MAKWQIDAMLDAALDYISTNGNEIYVCTSQPATRAAAISAKLNTVAIPSYQANADGDTNGRKLTVDSEVDMAISATGTATHVAICSGTVLLYVTTCTSQALTSGGTVTTPAWDIEIADAA